MWGPSKLLGMPNRYDMMIIGGTIGRFFLGFGFCSILPELAEGCLEKFDIKQLPPEIADKTGSMLSIIIAVGGTTFPQSVGILYGGGIDFRTIMDAFGIVGLTFSFIYILRVYEQGIGLFSCKYSQLTRVTNTNIKKQNDERIIDHPQHNEILHGKIDCKVGVPHGEELKE